MCASLEVQGKEFWKGGKHAHTHIHKLRVSAKMDITNGQMKRYVVLLATAQEEVLSEH